MLGLCLYKSPEINAIHHVIAIHETFFKCNVFGRSDVIERFTSDTNVDCKKFCANDFEIFLKYLAQVPR